MPSSLFGLFLYRLGAVGTKDYSEFISCYASPNMGIRQETAPRNVRVSLKLKIALDSPKLKHLQIFFSYWRAVHHNTDPDTTKTPGRQ
jgi:hypothetical protein